MVASTLKATLSCSYLNHLTVCVSVDFFAVLVILFICQLHHIQLVINVVEEMLCAYTLDTSWTFFSVTTIGEAIRAIRRPVFAYAHRSFLVNHGCKVCHFSQVYFLFVLNENAKVKRADEQKGINISGGQWQRLALARNFYRDAPIVILDEPTSAIDAAAEARIFRNLFCQTGKTTIAISHRLSTIKKADVIYFMKHGRIVEHGSYEALVKKRGEFYEMFKEQL